MHNRLLKALAVASPCFLPVAGQARPVVVELFTSQGCSSCPPAEALLSELSGQPDLLPLGFHVTYWDDLGWKDTFSLEAATNRQARYADQFGGGSYTPQLVVDGSRSMVGSRRGEASAAIASAKAEAASSAPVTLTRRNGRALVSVGAGHGDASILLVGFDRARRTAIGGGENGGRTIVQANVVRSLRTVGRWDGRAMTLAVAEPAGEEMAVILQRPDGKVIGAARPDPGT